MAKPNTITTAKTAEKPAVPASGPSSYEVPGFVCAILSIIVPVIGLLLGTLAIIFSVLQRKRAPSSMATASLVLGITGVVLQALITAYVVMVIIAIMNAPMY